MPVDASPYDALMLVSFGGPEKADDVVPFLEIVTAGKGIPRSRLAEVGEHYYRFGGKSPINDQCRDLLGAIRKDFATARLDIPVYWGNRNWDPFLKNTIAEMEADGIRRAACFVTSAYASYSGCRQYREDLFAATVGSSVQLDRLRHYFNHPGFTEPFVEATAEALTGLPANARVVFVTHSLPAAMNAASGGPDAFAYERQHQSVAQEVSLRVGRQLGRHIDWTMAYCSRSGPPSMPWLAPDINDHLRSLRSEGVTAVAVVPIGFISDHMEVIFDLDTEASATAQGLGMEFVRVATPRTHPRFVSMIRELLIERAAAERGAQPGRCSVGALGASPDRCAADCCMNAAASREAIGDA